VRVKDPNGNFIEESEFAANNIAIVDDLTGPKAKDYEAFDGDSDAEVKLFYDTDNQDFDGILIAEGLAETDGAGSFVWNTEGTPTGSYYIYAMVMDENNAPVFDYSQGRVQVTQAADLSVTQTINPDSVGVGTNFTYTVTVTNDGTISSNGVTLTQTLAEEVTFVSSTLTPATQSNNVLTFNLGNLAKGASKQVDITVTAPTTTGAIATSAEVSSNTFDPEKSNNANTLATSIEEIPPITTDLSVTRTDAPNPVVIGENYTYILTVKNSDASDATGVILTENLPSEVNFVSATASQGNAFLTFDGKVTANLGEIEKGNEATVSVTVTPFAAGNLVSTTEVTGNEVDSNLFNNSLISTKTVGSITPANADLELDYTADNLNPDVGDRLALTLTITNQGPGIASSIQVSALLPSQLSFVSASAQQGTYDNTTGVWDVGNIRDNLSRTLTLVADVTGAGSIDSVAEVTAVSEADPDSTPGNNNPNEDDFAKITLNVGGTPGQIVGTAGRDILNGTAQNDQIIGLQGRDTLTGGGGGDRFVYNSIVDAGDIITDFEVGSDLIDLSAVLDSFAYTGSNAIADGYVQFGSRVADTLIQIDPDGLSGSGRARPFILVEDVTISELDRASNFVF
jgi:uncharacterized repeat protein (TIGR01451 family)